MSEKKSGLSDRMNDFGFEVVKSTKKSPKESHPNEKKTSKG